MTRTARCGSSGTPRSVPLVAVNALSECASGRPVGSSRTRIGTLPMTTSKGPDDYLGPAHAECNMFEALERGHICPVRRPRTSCWSACSTRSGWSGKAMGRGR